jgi:hypothetical protein
MNNGGKISLKCVSTLIFASVFLCVTLNSSRSYSAGSNKIPVFSNDTVPEKIVATARDTVPADSVLQDTIPFRSDSLAQQTDTFHIKLSRDSLDAPISYSAADSVVLYVPTKKVTH